MPHIKQYKSDAKFEDIKPENNDLKRHIRKVPVTYFCIYIKSKKSYIKWIRMGTKT